VRHYEPFFIVIATLFLSLRRFFCHCDAFFVIASEARQSRWGMGLLRHPSSDGLPRNDIRGCVITSPFLLSLRRFFCHCDAFFVIASEARQSRPSSIVIASVAWQSHNSSYRSRHSLLTPLTNSIFLCLEPAFSCFSLEMALCISSQTS